MRIGILTYHRSINDGAVMQCYSLSKRLQQEIPDAGLVIFEGATHYAYLEQWQRFVAIAKNFFLKE